MAKVTVNTAKPYDILIEKGLLDRAGDLIRQTADGSAVCVVTDDTVDSLYGERLTASLENAGYRWEKFVIPHGEASKNADNFIKILNFLAEKQFTRTDVVAALGGGVVGDLAGFAAACYNRGMLFVQLPTTLLAAVDSSVGGKTAIDLDAGKNLAGAFYQPRLVLCDYATLDTLSDEIFRDGCAEAVKYGILASPGLFEVFEKGRVREELEAVIQECVAIKRDVVMADEFDRGQRQLLNLGHTLGHAIEKRSGFTVTHGQAVAIGTVLAARISLHLGLCKKETVERIQRTLRGLSLPTETDFSAKELAETALSDKKRRGDEITLILPEEIGSCRLYPVPVAELPGLAEAALREE